VQLSVVIPVFNEEQVIKFSLEKIFEILGKMQIKFEIIVVDDGSNDKTFEIVKNLAEQSSNLRLIKLNKNYGHMEALKVGMLNSRGNAILTIDADLQDPPEYIPTLFETLQEAIGGDWNKQYCVQTYRQDRKVDSYFKRHTASIYYWLIKRISGVKVVPDAADYRILSRSANAVLLDNYRRGSVFRLEIPYLEIPTSLLPIIRHKRFAGDSKYTNKKMIQLTLNSLLSFNQRPLRLLSIAGLVISLFMFLFAMLITFLSFFTDVIPGWTSLVLIILSSNAFIVFMIGFLGSYVGRIYENLQNQPTCFWTEFNLNE